jgi:hypothetical protein
MKKKDLEFYIQITAIVVLVGILMFSFGRSSVTGEIISTNTVSASNIIPTGMPAVYGQELGVNYDDISPNDPRLADSTIRKLAQYEDLELSGDLMQRYIKIAGFISCEYCCGVKSIIFDNGDRACGCAHSYAMRGLAKYLLTEYPNMSDDEVLSELGKWKVLFFPGIHEQKAQVLEANGIDSTNYINLASNLYRGIEQGQTSGGGMVGGC